ncbi:hypothetical protein CVT26_000903 [Gymnopilus dilepis]|uniref:Ubiquitin-like protease family profile domain-containing protein n=1 Tax=Gymnopilus dilepis TaxID=231916 RepID=A0A409WL75_9AGAR|nr:hypothetical protein CVT26_000903 [Gymnopilus dilepis]
MESSRGIEPTLQIVGSRHLITIRFDQNHTLWSSAIFNCLIVRLSHLKPFSVGINGLWDLAKVFKVEPHSQNPSPSWQSSETKHSSQEIISIPDQFDVALLYPANSRGGINIHWSDLSRLLPGKFLDDTLVEFGLKWWFKCLQERDFELAEQVHFFNSFFYKKLCEGKSADVAYKTVQRWTSKVDLFRKKYIVVPINESITPDAAVNVNTNVSTAYILVLDSLGVRHPNVVQQLNEYLKREAIQKKGIEDARAAIGRTLKTFEQT